MSKETPEKISPAQAAWFDYRKDYGSWHEPELSQVRKHFIAGYEAAAAALPQPVLDFINARPEYINALKNTRGDDDLGDYYRWNGHAEARRQLAQRLGYTVPQVDGDTTEKDTK